MAILEVCNIEKHFGPTRVLEDISFSLEQGQTLAIIGSSGSGKTTLLRCLNFLETPNQGTISVNGSVLFDASDPTTQRETEIRKKRLHFGLVFQSFNLFPQYTALQNVTLAKELLSQELPEYKQNKKAILEEIQAEGRELLARIDADIKRRYGAAFENEPPETPDDPGAAAWNVLAISANPASRWAPMFPTLALNEAMSATGATAPALHVCAYQ